MIPFKFLSILWLVLPTLAVYCDAPSPAFPLPNLDIHGAALNLTSARIYSAVKAVASRPEFDATSFSIEVTSQTRSLFDIQHTAKERSGLFDGGAVEIQSDTRYRIASMTKPFTVLALFQLHKAGKLSLDDPVLKYLPDLTRGQSGSLPWKDITLRALMSQQAGIPRDFAQDDFLNFPDLIDLLALPEIDRADLALPTCDEMVNYTRACNATDLFSYIKTIEPLFAPNQHSSYSNINYNLLGVVIARVANMTYDEYITTHILDVLGMNQTTFRQPPNSVAAIAKGIEYYWPFYMGVQNPTGGLYSSSSDLSKWLRYVLSTYNGQTPALNWFAPTSFGGSTQGFYGAPWEIFRAKVRDLVPEHSGLTSTRPVTFITKGGGLPAYSSEVIMLPEYGLGVTILVAGNGQAVSEIHEIVSRQMIGFAEDAALEELRHRYVGTFEHVDAEGNVTHRLTLDRSADHALFVTEWTADGIDVLAGLRKRYAKTGNEVVWHVVPTLLHVDEKNVRGARWRVIPSIQRPKDSDTIPKRRIWDNFCVSDWDFNSYAGKPLNEVIFWTDEDTDDQAVEVELSAYRTKLRRVSDNDHLGRSRFVEQT